MQKALKYTRSDGLQQHHNGTKPCTVRDDIIVLLLHDSIIIWYRTVSLTSSSANNPEMFTFFCVTRRFGAMKVYLEKLNPVIILRDDLASARRVYSRVRKWQGEVYKSVPRK